MAATGESIGGILSYFARHHAGIRAEGRGRRRSGGRILLPGADHLQRRRLAKGRPGRGQGVTLHHRVGFGQKSV